MRLYCYNTGYVLVFIIKMNMTFRLNMYVTMIINDELKNRIREDKTDTFENTIKLVTIVWQKRKT